MGSGVWFQVPIGSVWVSGWHSSGVVGKATRPNGLRSGTIQNLLLSTSYALTATLRESTHSTCNHTDTGATVFVGREWLILYSSWAFRPTFESLASWLILSEVRYVLPIPNHCLLRIKGTVYSSPESTMVGRFWYLMLPLPEPVASRALTTSRDSWSATSPKTTWRPLSQEVTTVVTKNWEPLLSWVSKLAGLLGHEMLTCWGQRWPWTADQACRASAGSSHQRTSRRRWTCHRFPRRV